MSTPRCALTCPRCHAELDATATYGPCADCRSGLNAAADSTLDDRLERIAQALADGFVWDDGALDWVRPGEPRPKVKPPVVARSKPVDSGVDCRLCGDPVAAGDAHPCCVLWIEGFGHARCWACAESKRTGRIVAPLRPPRLAPIGSAAAVRPIDVAPVAAPCPVEAPGGPLPRAPEHPNALRANEPPIEEPASNGVRATPETAHGDLSGGAL